MDYDVILIRYGEIALKSTYVRKFFESTLINNITQALHQETISHEITQERGRIYIRTSEISRTLSLLPRIFGIVSFSPALRTPATLKDMSTSAVHGMKQQLTREKSFAIRATRTGAHPFTSQQVAVQVGSDIVSTTHARVDLGTPDVELFIEIRHTKAFLFTEKISGAGGLPLGTQGNILALIDRPSALLAAWFLMRRGCNLVVVNTQKSYESLIQSFLRQWYADAPIVFVDAGSPRFLDDVAATARHHHCDAVVTGHRLENPTATVSEISRLKQHTQLPVLTPLIAMDAQELQQHCEKRGIAV